MSRPARHALLYAGMVAWSLTACATSVTADPVASRQTALASDQAIRRNAATVTGGLWLVPITDAQLQSAMAGQYLTYQGHPVWVGEIGGQATAVVGLGLSDAGKQSLQSADGQEIAVASVVERAYAEQHLTLTETQYVSPDPAQLARFEREAALQKETYRVYSPANDSTRPAAWPVFQWPLQGRVSSLFGLRRFFNGEPRAPHLGVDIAGKLGDPVLAPARGRVAQTGEFFFNGRTVIIDHGQGIFSMLCHFSQIEVKKGDIVEPDTVVGLVGATGRATAPHLHWTVSLNDARIDPRRLLVMVPEGDR